MGSQLNPGGYSAAWDATYQDFDGTKAIRVLNPCRNSDDFNSANCQWFDEPTLLSMQRGRWYSAAEPTGEGNIVIIGGFTSGGYINRNYPNIDPQNQGGAAESTYEYYPPNGATPQIFNFLVKTSGLNAYAHTFLMPSGKMFVQANTSTGKLNLFMPSYLDSYMTLPSSMGSRRQPRDTAPRYAQQCRSRISCIGRHGHASFNSSEQLHANRSFLWRIRHGGLCVGEL